MVESIASLLRKQVIFCRRLMTGSRREAEGRIKSLDEIRAIAVLMVLMC